MAITTNDMNGLKSTTLSYSAVPAQTTARTRPRQYVIGSIRLIFDFAIGCCMTNSFMLQHLPFSLNTIYKHPPAKVPESSTPTAEYIYIFLYLQHSISILYLSEKIDFTTALLYTDNASTDNFVIEKL